MNNSLPKHVAIIPDGNRRWAKENGKPSMEGHRYAAQTTLPNLINELIRFNIKYFTFWALSTENLVGRSKEELNNLFFAYYVTGHKKDIMRLVSGVTVYHIYAGDLSDLKITIPCKEEQIKIAKIFRNTDLLIKNKESQIAMTEQWKKGLMQEMFV